MGWLLYARHRVSLCVGTGGTSLEEQGSFGQAEVPGLMALTVQCGIKKSVCKRKGQRITE